MKKVYVLLFVAVISIIGCLFDWEHIWHTYIVRPSVNGHCFRTPVNDQGFGPDTLVSLPSIPHHDLLTWKEAYKSNPMITGTIKGWEKRVEGMFEQSGQVKTMIMDDSFAVSDKPTALYNNVCQMKGPILLCVRNKEDALYWDLHDLDSAAFHVNYQHVFIRKYGRLGPGREKHVYKNSHPIHLCDTSAFVPIMYVDGTGRDAVLCECINRGKSVLICTMDYDELQKTPEGRYVWEAIVDYSYSVSFREGLTELTRPVSRDEWFETFRLEK